MPDCYYVPESPAIQAVRSLEYSSRWILDDQSLRAYAFFLVTGAYRPSIVARVEIAAALVAPACGRVSTTRSDSLMRTKLLIAARSGTPAQSLAGAGAIGQIGDADRHRDRCERSGPARRHGNGGQRIGHRRLAITTDRRERRLPLPGAAAGTYTVTVELSGFKPSAQEARLQLGQTITLDMKLEVGGLTDTITVAATSPTVDVKSSAAQKNLTEEMMENIPFTSRFGPGAMLLAPGVNPNNYSAYGSGGDIVERLHDRRRRRQRSRGRHHLGVREPQLDPGSAGHRPRRHRRIRRLHRGGVEQPVPLRQQPLLGAVRDAVPERRA